VRKVLLVTIICYVASAVFGLDLSYEPLLFFVATSIVMSLWQIRSTVLHFRKHPLKNFPARYRRGARASWMRLAMTNLVIASVAGISGYLAVTYNNILFGLFFVLSGTAFLCACLVTPGSIAEVPAVIILPYFKETVGHIETFIGGKVLARRVCMLDAMAAELGLTPISAFGYKDDLNGEELTWHDPERGIETISGLLRKLHRGPDSIDDAPNIISDLDKIHDALRAARKKGIPFCFIVRRGSGASGQEMVVRKGSFF
jgi:hypothetical protein